MAAQRYSSLRFVNNILYSCSIVRNFQKRKMISYERPTSFCFHTQHHERQEGLALYDFDQADEYVITFVWRLFSLVFRNSQAKRVVLRRTRGLSCEERDQMCTKEDAGCFQSNKFQGETAANSWEAEGQWRHSLTFQSSSHLMYVKLYSGSVWNT